MDEIGKILPPLFRNQIRGSDPHLLEIVHPLWPLIAGKRIAQHSQPCLLASGILTLTSDSASWSMQLQHLSKEICSAVNRFFGKPVVNKLRIKTVTPSRLFSDSPRSGTAPSAPLLAEQGLDTKAIADPSIAAAMARAYSKYFTRPRR